jgi:hypothetical protein
VHAGRARAGRHRGIPGQRLEAGFPMIVRVFDEEAVERFALHAHLVPSLYDLV